MVERESRGEVPVRQVGRRTVLKATGAAVGALATTSVGGAAPSSCEPRLRVALLADAHLGRGERDRDRTRALERAMEGIEALRPGADLLVFCGNLGHRGDPDGARRALRILESSCLPLELVAGAHDWYRDLGRTWRERFGEPTRVWRTRGVHCVALHTALQEDFWSGRGLSGEQRMQAVAQLDRRVQSDFRVGPEQCARLERELRPLADSAPVLVFGSVPLHDHGRAWNFGAVDGALARRPLRRFRRCAVVHGHLHQPIAHRVEGVAEFGVPSTAWTWPYPGSRPPGASPAPHRVDPGNPFDGCGFAVLDVRHDGDLEFGWTRWGRAASGTRRLGPGVRSTV